ncbi:actin-like ATPase domain-containing protein [Terfezia boudieri ATCC MYA-4762]|uniref:Xylulose kinase n=1 Tax=Terfezia boudieri ATCC MYA-4762 TaxID=1051890 RepID=A0A3N4M1I1_9PEZI|nr:actin-like ATPase domain-containing protein [Terfezia boudieri ATCC MYA-4762]
MSYKSPLYLGFDLSTQQLKTVAVSSTLQLEWEEAVSFDDDLPHYNVSKGVHKNTEENEVYSPVAMWIEALDLVLTRMKEKGFDFSRVEGISGAGQQHASVFWSEEATHAFEDLQKEQRLVDQLSPRAFAHPWSPNWQDHSTQTECDIFEEGVGGEDEMARISGSSAHHRFTGPQILRLKQRLPEVYKASKRITIASSFLTSVFLGKIAPFDVSDVCGMNLWNVEELKWDEKLLALAAGGEDRAEELKEKLGLVESDGGKCLGSVSKYFVERYGFPSDCSITLFTGDNPATILALPLRPLDVIVSLGTSTTLLMSTPTYYPSPAYHLFDHPTTSGLYMFMLCYCNGALAREHIRDKIQSYHNRAETGQESWNLFNELATSTPPLGKQSESDPAKIAFYFPLSEIVPNVQAGTWRYTFDGKTLSDDSSAWSLPDDDARAIIESQALSMRLRAAPLLTPCAENNQKSQPRRVYLVGGGSRNPAICEIIGQVLGGSEGVYQLDVGSNACAVGAAYKACWAVERKEGEKFENFVGERWDEKKMVKRIGDAYKEGIWEAYGEILGAFKEGEGRIIAEKHN